MSNELNFDEDFTDNSKVAEEVATEDSVTEESASEEVATEDSATERSATEEVVTEDSATEEVTTEDSDTEEVVIEDSATEEVIYEGVYIEGSEKIKRKPKEKKRKPLTKKQKIYIGVGIAGVLASLIALKAMLGGSDTTYFDNVNTIITSDLGSFEYVIDVRTSEHEEDTKLHATNYSESQLEGLEGESTETPDTNNEEGKHQGSITDSWNNKENIKTSDWKYPNYKLIISGQTTSLEPYTTYYKISLATEYFNDMLTELYCFEGNYYINIEQLRYWLRQSQDSYLVKLGNDIEDGSKWLVIPEDKFIFNSRYAELDENGSVKGLYNIKERGTTLLSMLVSTLRDTSSKDSLSEQDNMRYFVLKNPNDVVNRLKSLVTNGGSLYDSYLEATKSTYTEEQFKQAIDEKDNFIKSLYDLMVYLNITSAEDIDLDMQGMTRTYTDSSNNDVIEATLNSAFTSGVTDYRVNISMLRSGNVTEIVKPSGSMIGIEDYINPNLIGETLNNVCDYLNFTNIKTEVRLNTSIESIKNDVNNSFIELMNKTNLVYVTENNFYSILENYKEYDKDGVLEEIVKSYKNLLKEDEKEIVEEKKEVTTLNGNLNDGVSYKVEKSKSDSNDRLYVLDLNVSGAEIKTTDFSIKSNKSDTYPCNNEVMLKSYNKDFDILSAVPTTTSTAKLFFVIPSSVEELSLYYNDTLLGVLTR